MGGLFGSKKGQNTSDQRVNSLQVNQATYGNCIALVYGRTRVPPFLAWYDDFTATAHTTQQPGGKGGGGGPTNTTYTYTAAVILALCEGPIAGVHSYWSDKSHYTDLSTPNSFTFFNGAGGQAIWSYLTTRHPAAAIPYDHTGFLAASSLALDSSGGLSNYTFELDGLLQYGGSIVDAEPNAISID